MRLSWIQESNDGVITRHREDTDTQREDAQVKDRGRDGGGGSHSRETPGVPRG